MGIYELVRKYTFHNPDGHYFDRDTLKFFGERLSEMRVLKKTEKVKDCMGVEHEAYVVSSVQRPPFGKPFRHYAWFDVNTFEQILV